MDSHFPLRISLVQQPLGERGLAQRVPIIRQEIGQRLHLQSLTRL